MSFDTLLLICLYMKVAFIAGLTVYTINWNLSSCLWRDDFYPQWEQKYLEESTMRQLDMQESSAPSETRLAVLEQSSMDTEKLIDEAKTEKLKQMEEVYYANRKLAELEAK